MRKTASPRAPSKRASLARGENTREAQSLTPGRVRGGRRRGRPSARRRHQLRLSALGVTQSQLGCARAYQGFKDLSKRVRSLPRLPTLLFGNSSNSPEVLRSSRKCARNTASGDWLLMGDHPISPRPESLPGWDGASYALLSGSYSHLESARPQEWRRTRVYGDFQTPVL